MQLINDKFAIFGNPVKHSKSPYIYSLFASKAKIYNSNYIRILATQDNFKKKFFNFFKNGGLGANITSPFKENAYLLCDVLTKNSLQSKSVNTVKKQKNGLLLGHNTDGIGLINDLKKLNFINLDYNNVLIIGAGGASKGIISSLIDYGFKITITNRTFKKANELILQYNYNQIQAIPIDKLIYPDYTLIINATSSSMYGKIPKLKTSLITNKTCCYDLYYSKNDTSFILWCKSYGAKKCADGIGMLIQQAAHSFLMWHRVLPSVEDIVFNLYK
ncbi:MAG: shikimate dehydrogenase [Enterobacterales bacterium]